MAKPLKNFLCETVLNNLEYNSDYLHQSCASWPKNYMGVCMQKTKFFICCAGAGERWGNYLGIDKQHIAFGGETLLERTIRLLGAYTDSLPALVDELGRFNANGARQLLIPPTNCIAQTLYHTRSQWGERNIFLLGDVFYSYKAMGQIVNGERNLCFYGRPHESLFSLGKYGEIFAFTFTQENFSLVEKHLGRVIEEQQKGGRGKLWELHRSLSGQSLSQHVINLSCFELVEDETDDFDSPKEYERNRRRYEVLTNPAGMRSSLFLLFIKICRRSFRLRRLLTHYYHALLRGKPRRARTIRVPIQKYNSARLRPAK